MNASLLSRGGLAPLVALLAACGGSSRAEPPRPPSPTPAPPVARFDVRPGAEVLSGEPLEIRLEGFSPGAEIELIAERPVTAPWKQPPRELYRSRATFATDAAGALDLAAAAPRTGSYAGVDRRGLFWSMTATGGAVPDGWPDERVRLVARQAGRAPVEATLTLRKSDPAVQITAAGPELPGAILARLPGSEPRPVVIVLGGSEGGDSTARDFAPRLASHGYAVLGLPYYAPPYLNRRDLALPSAFVDIPVDRLEAARDWLRGQPGVDVDRIAVWGISKGAELALLAASKFSWLDAAVAIAPTDVVYEGWGAPGQTFGTRSSFSWRGAPLPFVPYAGMDQAVAELARGHKVALRVPHDRGRAANPQAVERARIRVEDFRGALLVAGGIDDQMWASGDMARRIAERRAAAGLATTVIAAADAGHALSGDGWSPTTQYASFRVELGGTPAGNAHGQVETWAATLAFLAEALAPPPAR